MTASTKSHQLKLLAILTCPLLAVAGVIVGSLGMGVDSVIMQRFGTTVFTFGMILLFPLGIISATLSYRMSHLKPLTASDSRDLVEFLLGSAGLVMIILGAVLSPVTFWLAHYL